MEDPIKKAAELLLQGSKMLNISCPNCDSPIYQLRDGTMICTTCNKQVVTLDQVSSDPEIKSEKVVSKPIQAKIDQLGLQLQNETDPTKILELAKLINELEQLVK